MNQSQAKSLKLGIERLMADLKNKNQAIDKI